MAPKRRPAPGAPEPAARRRRAASPGAVRRRPAAAAPPPSTLECVICVEEKPLADFPGHITSKCAHARGVCSACVARTIDLEVNGKGNSTRIICPHPECPEELQPEDVRREASKAVFERYDQLLLRQCLQRDPTFRWCANTGCGSGQIVEGFAGGDGRNVFLRCHGCQQRTCVFHRCPWHNERTCHQYDQDARNSDEVALLQFFSQGGTMVRCPTCGHGIQKNGGCDHMTCRKEAGGCGAEFCFRCLADYNGAAGILTVGNSAHKPSCPWYFPIGDDDDEGVAAESDDTDGTDSEESPSVVVVAEAR